MSGVESSAQLLRLGTLLQLEEEIRGTESEQALEFLVVNDTYRLVPYRQAVLWRPGLLGEPVVRLVSGLVDVHADSPFKQWLTGAIRHVAGEAERLLAPSRLSAEELPAALAADWGEWSAPCVVHVPLPNPAGKPVGGLWLACDTWPDEAAMTILARLGKAYGHALWAWRPHEPRWRTGWNRWKQDPRRRRLAWAALAVLLVPMRLTVQAPAEIVGREAKVIAAPVDGVVAKFFVKPNQAVQAGTPLLTLDDTTFRNRFEVADKARAVAQAEYLRAMQKSFSDDQSKAELAGLKARFEEKAAEAQFSQDQADRIVVAAPNDGVAVFSDVSDWQGRPVQTGERIMSIADPAQVQVAIYLPVDDAITLEPGAAARLYLNVSPLSSLDATLTQTSYEPAHMPEGYAAYRLRADLAAGEPIPRLGLKGTAKLYGDWAPLAYHMVRKPLAVLRRWLGV